MSPRRSVMPPGGDASSCESSSSARYLSKAAISATQVRTRTLRLMTLPPSLHPGQIAATIVGERFRLRRQVGQHEAHEVGLAAELERQVEAPLEADRRVRLAAEPLAAGCAAEVRGKDLEVIRQRQQPAVD